MHDPAKDVDLLEELEKAVRSYATWQPAELHGLFTSECAKDPKAGDVYHEMCSYEVHVVSVGSGVEIYRGSGEDFHTEVMPVAEFVKYLSYKSVPGCWVDIAMRAGQTVTKDMIEDWWQTATGGNRVQ